MPCAGFATLELALDLPGSRLEAAGSRRSGHRARRVRCTRVLSGRVATKTIEAGRDRAARDHLATHGFFLQSPCGPRSRARGGQAHREPAVADSRQPAADDRLAFAGANVGDGGRRHNDDGILTAEEVAGLNLQNRMAVLSACDTDRADKSRRGCLRPQTRVSDRRSTDDNHEPVVRGGSIDADLDAVLVRCPVQPSAVDCGRSKSGEPARAQGTAFATREHTSFLLGSLCRRRRLALTCRIDPLWGPRRGGTTAAPGGPRPATGRARA